MLTYIPVIRCSREPWSRWSASHRTSLRLTRMSLRMPTKPRNGAVFLFSLMKCLLAYTVSAATRRRLSSVSSQMCLCTRSYLPEVLYLCAPLLLPTTFSKPLAAMKRQMHCFTDTATLRTLLAARLLWSLSRRWKEWTSVANGTGRSVKDGRVVPAQAPGLAA